MVLLPVGVRSEVVEQTDLAVLGMEGRHQHERIVDVAAGRGPLPFRCYGAVATVLPAKQPAKAAPRVDPGHTAPVYGAASRDQRPGTAIANKGVVTDRRVGRYLSYEDPPFPTVHPRSSPLSSAHLAGTGARPARRLDSLPTQAVRCRAASSPDERGAREPGGGEPRKQPAAVGVRPPLVALVRRAPVEVAVCPGISRHGLVEVVLSIRVGELVRLLSVVAGPGQVAVQRPWDDPVPHYRLDCGEAHPEFVTAVMGCPVDRLGSDLGLEDRGHRLRLARQPAPYPPELWRIERRHLNHRELDVAAVVQQLAPQ